MEGNDCYKFATIRNYIDLTGAEPVRLAIDVGANIGLITRMIKEYFPVASVYAYEPVPEYRALASANTKDLPHVVVLPEAVTGAHLFDDDLAQHSRSSAATLRILKAMPGAGPGWLGGSFVVPANSEVATRTPFGYTPTDDQVPAVTLAEVIVDVLAREGAQQVDVLKMDCEGCECSALGTSTPETLQRIRFIVGEYHQIDRFYTVMATKLFSTHKVSLVGDRDLGAFFAERLDGTADGILKYDKTGMLLPRPWLGPQAMEWHLFEERYVPVHERRWHGFA
jgi:FkbM family methyltransferase